ncbi:MAG: hypothetical protein JWN34_5096 [Bryobacterales bacterium]|jgi:type IV secretory pathway VirB10-like protein|nr:hypothetical protein [Bryobacterales bacterium]
MAALKDGIQLNQPAPSVHRANRKPLYIAVIGLIVVFCLLIWAWVARTNMKTVSRAKEEATHATPAISAIKSLDKQWEEKKPEVQPITLQPVEQPVVPSFLARQPAPQTSAPMMMQYPIPSPPTPPLPQVTPVQQAKTERENEQLAAWDSPLMPSKKAEPPSQPSNPLPSPTSPVMPPPAVTMRGSGGPGDDYLNQNLQDSKKGFAGVGQDKTSPIIAASGQLPPYIVKAGWDIPAILEQSANSDLPGELRARVRENVYDTGSGKFLLIPQNSILVGRYNSDVAYGQNRIQVNWDRLQRPGNEATIFLNQMNGVEANGSGGLAGHVNNHFKRLIGFSMLSSVFAAGIQISQNRNNSGTVGYPSASEAVGTAVGQQMGEFGRKITERNLNRPPTIQLLPGTRFNVRVDRDIIFAEPAR